MQEFMKTYYASRIWITGVSTHFSKRVPEGLEMNTSTNSLNRGRQGPLCKVLLDGKRSIKVKINPVVSMTSLRGKTHSTAKILKDDYTPPNLFDLISHEGSEEVNASKQRVFLSKENEGQKT
jgi:hypothetical protein